jgi:putative membrane protein
MSEQQEGQAANRPPDDSLRGPSRRTVLASERTWLAWFRTGIAVSAAAIAVGGVIPHLVDTSQNAFIALGVGYAILAACVFIHGYFRHKEIAHALEADLDVPSGEAWMLGLTLGGALLALATLLVVIIDG